MSNIFDSTHVNFDAIPGARRLPIVARRAADASVPPTWQATKSSGLLSDVLADRLAEFHKPTLHVGMVVEFLSGCRFRLVSPHDTASGLKAWDMVCIEAGPNWAVGETSWDYESDLISEDYAVVVA